MAVVLAGAMPLAGQTLRQAAAARGIPIGAAAGDGELSPDWITVPDYASVLSTQYDMLEPGNAMKWWVTQPTSPTSFDFTSADTLVAFAQKYNMLVRGHNLCWHSDNPQWLVGSTGTGGYASTASKAQMAALLQNHINTEVTHFAGQVFAWDVVNEAFSDSTPTTLSDSIWYNQPGIGIGTGSGAATDTGYIEQAFRWAHAADPNALLFYNDYGIEGPGPKFDAVLAMVTDFVNRGVPINGVGFEMHLELNNYPNYYPSPAGLAQNMQALAALGIQVHITEMDVRLPVNSSGVASQTDLDDQAQMFQDVLTVCLQQPNCTAFQVWGVSYNDSWIQPNSSICGATPCGDALPFDSNYTPTPAFNALMTAMETASPFPVLKTTDVVNAAGYQGGAVSPGELLAIYAVGFGFGSLTPVTFQMVGNSQYPIGLGGAQFLFGGKPGPVIYAQQEQVNVVVPFDVADTQQIQIQYQFYHSNDYFNGPISSAVQSNVVTMPVVAAVPAIFSLDGSGSGPGAILNWPDNSVNSASNPAAAGGYVQIFGTGGGVVVGPAMEDGALAPGAWSLATQPVTATIGGLPATVQYAGSAPGLVNGVLQVNLRIPSGLAPGPQPVVITIGTAQSQPGITVAVK